MVKETENSFPYKSKALFGRPGYCRISAKKPPTGLLFVFYSINDDFAVKKIAKSFFFAILHRVTIIANLLTFKNQTQ